ncbi:MAG TPA: PEP-CTERM sorting domain-containing protein, partial [Bryobacteraceae bacterium]|nr:PEP-CTERM sorting domain-containing protein [Bryobacteraceae bacterium]
SPDTFIDYGFSVKNNTDVALDFVFVFRSPFVGGPYNVLGSAHGGNLINGTGAGGTDDTVALLPFGQANVHQPFIVGIGDVNGLNTGCAAEVGSPGSLACPVAPDPSVSVTPIATGATGVFGVRVQFTLSPGDLYAANGRIELATSGDPVVPEPGTYALLASGLIGIVAVARRRRAA